MEAVNKSLPKVKLQRAQIGKQTGIDTTVKSSSGMAKWFAPSWEMVMKHKSGEYSDDRYTQLYTEILDNIPNRVWSWLYEKSDNSLVTLLCYCRDGKFCHTHLIIDYAVKYYPDWFEDGRS